ncbi:MAG: hypothetical protein BYD32DRAFT_404966 [Podila humilis]|nr:MAG: hypothetical protein BYD32DRAFT_404966 [Podila humilis]
MNVGPECCRRLVVFFFCFCSPWHKCIGKGRKYSKWKFLRREVSSDVGRTMSQVGIAVSLANVGRGGLLVQALVRGWVQKAARIILQQRLALLVLPVQAGQDVLERVLGALLQLHVNVDQVLVVVVVVAAVVLLLDDCESLM